MVVISKSVEETITLGKKLVETITPPAVIALIGDLGGGKTHFTKGLAQGLGVTEAITSPTFVLRKDYLCSHPQIKTLYHFDAYRLSTPESVESVGLNEALADPTGAVVIEWADRIEKLLPKYTRKVRFEYVGEGGRKISI